MYNLTYSCNKKMKSHRSNYRPEFLSIAFAQGNDPC